MHRSFPSSEGNLLLSLGCVALTTPTAKFCRTSPVPAPLWGCAERRQRSQRGVCTSPSGSYLQGWLQPWEEAGEGSGSEARGEQHPRELQQGVSIAPERC